jgi:hypothetical protein
MRTNLRFRRKLIATRTAVHHESSSISRAIDHGSCSFVVEIFVLRPRYNRSNMKTTISATYYIVYVKNTGGARNASLQLKPCPSSIFP